MSWNSIVHRRKQTANKFKENWADSSDGNVAVIEARPARTRAEQEPDRSNPLDSTAISEATRAPRQAPPRAENQRQALLTLRARLQGDVIERADTALSGCGIEQSCGSPDTADRASEIVEQDVVLGLLGSATATLDQIDASLERIEDGTYERCVQCGARIPAARLEALPYATCCVQCAARQERAPS